MVLLVGRYHQWEVLQGLTSFPAPVVGASIAVLSRAFRVGTVVFVVDVEMLPLLGRVILVMLQDGRQVEGELIALTGCHAVGDDVFEPWEIEELYAV